MPKALTKRGPEVLVGTGVVVGVGVDNVPACRAYEKVGFRRLAPGDSFCRCELQRLEPSPASRDPETARALWDATLRWAGVSLPPQK